MGVEEPSASVVPDVPAEPSFTAEKKAKKRKQDEGSAPAVSDAKISRVEKSPQADKKLKRRKR